MISGVIDTTALFEAVVAAFVAGVGMTLVFAVALYGAARSGELNREGQASSALLYAAVAVLGGVAFVAALVVGIIVITSK